MPVDNFEKENKRKQSVNDPMDFIEHAAPQSPDSKRPVCLQERVFAWFHPVGQQNSVQRIPASIIDSCLVACAKRCKDLKRVRK